MAVAVYIYPEQKVASVNELYIPVDRPVEFSITADSPMSAFWIPNLGSQVYAMNGMTAKLHLEASEPGEYRGSNSNISGEGYADMSFKTVAVSDAKFDKWINDRARSSQSMNWNSYSEIARQTRDKRVHYYVLEDGRLYDQILTKYMGHMDHSNEAAEDDTMIHMQGTQTPRMYSEVQN
jgi:cytochrome o ubiquinol oxidase subunit 2